MQMMSPDEFFARFGTPDTWHPIDKCGGIIGPNTTRDELIRRGFKPAAADEALRYRDELRSRAPAVPTSREEGATDECTRN